MNLFMLGLIMAIIPWGYLGSLGLIVQLLGLVAIVWGGVLMVTES